MRVKAHAASSEVEISMKLNRVSGHWISAWSQRARTTKNHRAGKRFSATALATAVNPTPTAVANLARPSRLQMSATEGVSDMLISVKLVQSI